MTIVTSPDVATCTFLPRTRCCRIHSDVPFMDRLHVDLCDALPGLGQPHQGQGNGECLVLRVASWRSPSTRLLRRIASRESESFLSRKVQRAVLFCCAKGLRTGSRCAVSVLACCASSVCAVHTHLPPTSGNWHPPVPKGCIPTIILPAKIWHPTGNDRTL